MIATWFDGWEKGLRQKKNETKKEREGERERERERKKERNQSVQQIDIVVQKGRPRRERELAAGVAMATHSAPVNTVLTQKGECVWSS